MSKPDKRPVHVAEIKKSYKGKVHVSTYLRRTFCEDGKMKNETVGNISDLPEVTDEEHFPGERLIVCRNPLLADERARKREELLKATEKDLDKTIAATQRTRKPLQGEDAIGPAGRRLGP